MLSRKTISSSKIPFFLKRLMQASFRDLRAGIAQAQPADYRGVDKSLARPGRKQAQKHVRDARDFNNIETQAVIKFFFFLQGKAPKEFHAILTETLACFLPGRSKDLSAPLYIPFYTASYCNRFTARKYHWHFFNKLMCRDDQSRLTNCASGQTPTTTDESRFDSRQDQDIFLIRDLLYTLSESHSATHSMDTAVIFRGAVAM